MRKFGGGGEGGGGFGFGVGGGGGGEGGGGFGFGVGGGGGVGGAGACGTSVTVVGDCCEMLAFPLIAVTTTDTLTDAGAPGAAAATVHVANCAPEGTLAFGAPLALNAADHRKRMTPGCAFAAQKPTYCVVNAEVLKEIVRSSVAS